MLRALVPNHLWRQNECDPPDQHSIGYIGCDEEGHIVSLDLSGYVTTIPPQIALLTHLQVLILSGNNLTNIPYPDC